MQEIKAIGSVVSAAYNQADDDLRLRYSKVGCVLALILMPAGVSLDYYVYPDRMWSFLKVRLAADVLIATVLALHFTQAGRRNVKALSLSWAVIVQLSITYMIFISEGAISPYYAGLNMVTLAVAVLSPWTYGETLLACVITLGAYVAACFLHRASAWNSGIFFNNVYFLVLTDIICVTSSFFTSRSRFNDFALRHELDLRNKQLADLDRLKSEFFANVSHEFRTPLTLIVSPLDQLLEHEAELPARVRESLAIMRDNALRLLKLISDLLEIVRLEDKRSQLKFERINLASFVPAMVDSVRHLAQVKGLRITAAGEEKSLEVSADPYALERVVLNMLSNAIKFTPAGGSINAHWKKQNESAVIEFSDTGIGIGEKDLPHVFDRFHQADGSATRKFQGVGVGLALARELVLEHKGKLSAQSQVGKGSTFVVELPLLNGTGLISGEHGNSRADDPIAAIYSRANRTIPSAATSARPGEEISGTGQFLILIVDDEPDMRRFLASTLSENYRVAQAADGRAGLELAEKLKPDLALLDLMLPELNGLDVCGAIKKNPQIAGMKIVLLTARADESPKIEALQRGADDFLTKPFSTLELKTRISNLLMAAKLEAEVRRQNTELQQTLKQLHETEAQLVQSGKMNALGSLAAGLLHEINNPLNYMIMAHQVAQQSCTENAELSETLRDLGEGMNRIRAIISDLRAFAYPASSGNAEEFELSEAIEMATRLVSHELKDAKVSSDGINGCRLIASKTQIIQVLVNLLLNSLKAVKEKQDGAIRISASPLKERMSIKVHDNGAGIKDSNLQKIFDPFFSTRPVGEGMGLGLSICHTIIKNHGGNISARSEEGLWTEITFDLPCCKQEHK